MRYFILTMEINSIGKNKHLHDCFRFPRSHVYIYQSRSFLVNSFLFNSNIWMLNFPIDFCDLDKFLRRKKGSIELHCFKGVLNEKKNRPKLYSVFCQWQTAILNCWFIGIFSVYSANEKRISAHIYVYLFV